MPRFASQSALQTEVALRIDRAQRAAQSGISELCAEREATVLARALAEYRASQLTPEGALRVIAVINELRSLAAQAARDIELADKVGS